MYFGAADVFVGILRGIHLKKGDVHDNANTTCAGVTRETLKSEKFQRKTIVITMRLALHGAKLPSKGNIDHL